MSTSTSFRSAPSNYYGTAAAAEFFLSVALLAFPAAGDTAELSPLPDPAAHRRLASSDFGGCAEPSFREIGTFSIAEEYVGERFIDFPRPTTSKEHLIGDIRRGALLGNDWDGEGSFAPKPNSMSQAVGFVRLLPTNSLQLESTFNASGNVGLFYHDTDKYADVEFMGDGRIAYYVERHGDKHKGIFAYHEETLPEVIRLLLSA